MKFNLIFVIPFFIVGYSFWRFIQGLNPYHAAIERQLDFMDFWSARARRWGWCSSRGSVIKISVIALCYEGKSELVFQKYNI